MNRPSTGLAVVACALALGAVIHCGSSSRAEKPGPDAQVDAGSDGAPDAETDASVGDGAARAEAGSDAAADAETDAGDGAAHGRDGGDGGLGELPPSCAPGGAGMTNCGPGGTESCCTSLQVDGDTYFRTYTYDDAGAPVGEADPATVSSFRLDKYLVTVGRFRQFASAARPDADAGLAWSPQAGSGKHTHLHGGLGLSEVDADGGVTYEPGWVAQDDSNILPGGANADFAILASYETWTPSPGARENLPINGVTWAEAYAFCIWDGGFLPSEAEYGYAAAGGSQQREYPWGSTDPGTSNAYAIYSCNFNPTMCASAQGFAPVGTATLGAGRWGQLDLAGELSEWDLDLWHDTYPDPCVDCTDLSSASGERVNRGGGVSGPASLLVAWDRGGGGSFPINRTNIGFRCARTP